MDYPMSVQFLFWMIDSADYAVIGAKCQFVDSPHPETLALTKI